MLQILQILAVGWDPDYYSFIHYFFCFCVHSFSESADLWNKCIKMQYNVYAALEETTGLKHADHDKKNI